MNEPAPPRFEVAAIRRPVDLIAAGRATARLGPVTAPYVATQAVLTGAGPAELALSSGPAAVIARFTTDAVTLHVTADGRTTDHRSRRHGRPDPDADAVALTLTGPQVTAFTRERGAWVARSRFDLTERDGSEQAIDPHRPDWLTGLGATANGPLDDVCSGPFGQLGLRDLRVVSRTDGTAYRTDDDSLLLTASSAGPGWFPTGHTSVWALDIETFELTHRADLFLRRGGRVFGDHAVHLVRDDEDDAEKGSWLLAASTWGDFHATERPVCVVLARSIDDLTRGSHVLDAHPLSLPTDGLRSVGTWDPHLARTEAGWLVAFVSATRYFRFHPALAAGPTLDSLHLLASGPARRQARRECEGPTLQPTADGWQVLASDRRSRSYPVYDLELRQTGMLSATYPSNIPWPTMVETPSGRLLIGFDGTTYGGDLVGYGSHGSVVFQREAR